MPRPKDLFRKFILDCFADTDNLAVEEINNQAVEAFDKDAIEGLWLTIDEMVADGVFRRVDHGRRLERT